MTISSLTYQRSGTVTRAIATSTLVGALFVWFLDGSWVGTTGTGTKDFVLQVGDFVRLEVIDTTNPAFDVVANAPAGFPARRSLWWVRSSDADVDRYLVEQSKDGGAYAAVAIVPQTVDAWALGWRSGRLVDLSSYAWRITPFDVAGNAGTPLVIGPETIVRRPDPPAFVVTAAGGHVTFAVAP